jgi:hypothetical protein
MVFVRIQGKSVCDYTHTLQNYFSQLIEAEIDIPLEQKIQRFQYLKARYDSACHGYSSTE